MKLVAKHQIIVKEVVYTIETDGGEFTYAEWIDDNDNVVDDSLTDSNGWKVDSLEALTEVRKFVSTIPKF